MPSLVGDFLKRKKEGNATEEEEDAILNIANTVYSGEYILICFGTLSLIKSVASHI